MYRLESIGGAEVARKVEELLNELFVVSVPHFQAGGSLRGVLRTCAASLIAFHNEITRDFGSGHAISRHLEKAARKVGISDPRHPGLSPESLLTKWSDLVMQDFERRNTQFSPTCPNLVSISNSMDEMKSMMTKMMRVMVSLEEKQQQTSLKLVQREVEVSSLQDRVADTEQ